MRKAATVGVNLVVLAPRLPTKLLYAAVDPLYGRCERILLDVASEVLRWSLLAFDTLRAENPYLRTRLPTFTLRALLFARSSAYSPHPTPDWTCIAPILSDKSSTEGTCEGMQQPELGKEKSR